MAQPSRLDRLYRRMLITKFFEKGWDKPENLRRLFEFRKFVSNRDSCYNLVPRDYPVQLTREEKTSECRIIEGRFITPMEFHLPGLVPKESIDAHFQMILPLKWQDEKHKPMCIHLAGTGDHFYWKRRNFLAKPLLKEGNIGAILLENPFYGVRKPEEQVRSNLQNVSDIFVMGGCLILENLVLLHFCERIGLGPLGISGLSMGGHMASLSATNWPKPLVLVPCLSWSTAAAVFTQGVMSQSINWDMLESQYFSDGDYRERLAKMVTIVDESFLAGQNFVKHFNKSMTHLKRDIRTMTKDPNSETHEELVPYLEDEAVENIALLNQEIKELNKDIHMNDEHWNFVEKVADKKLHEKSKLETILPNALPEKAREPIDTTKVKWWEREALQFMRGMMDECTHLKNFSVPYDTSLITAVCAKDDAYVPREGCSSLEEIWPGAHIKYLDAGHISAYVLHQKLMRSSIIECFEKAKEKYELFKEPIIPTMTMNDLENQRDSWKRQLKMLMMDSHITASDNSREQRSSASSLLCVCTNFEYARKL